MSLYLLVKPHPFQSVVIDADTYLIEVPDDVSPWTVDVPTAADDPRFAIIPLLENLQYEETPTEPMFPLAKRFTVGERCVLPGHNGSYPDHNKDRWGHVVDIARRVETRIVETLVVQFDGEEPRGINPDVIAHGDDWRHASHRPS